MQFDLLRAFPYPVLRPKVNDYTDGDIQATVDFAQALDQNDITADIKFALSVPEIIDLVSAGHASYAVVFACRDTYFRKTVMSNTQEFRKVFPTGVLRGEVLIYPYVTATKKIDGFTCPWINEEFGPGPFYFDEGSVLALDEPQVIYVDREAFKPISSAFLLVANANISDYEWRVDPSGDKVLIQVSSSMKERIDAVRSGPQNKAVLLNSIYFGAVMQCLSYLKQAGGEYDTRRWACIMRQKCADLNLDLDSHDEAILAQHLMKYPFSLVDAYCFKENGE